MSFRYRDMILSYLRVAAPFDGVISTRFVHPGGDLKPGDEIVDHATDEIRQGADLKSAKS